MRYIILPLVIITATLTSFSDELSNFADSLRKQYDIPELGYVVLSPDSIIEIDVSGYNRNDHKIKEYQAELSDYFHLGSNTKAITGFVAGYLVDRSVIDWDTKFYDLFPEWKTDSSAFTDITLELLLSHRAGIPPFTSGVEYSNLPDFKGTTAEKRKQFVRYLLSLEKVSLGPNGYTYSNAGYSIAALMLERVSDKTWEELISTFLVEKLSVDVRFGWPILIDENQPFGHWIEADTLRPLGREIEYQLQLSEPAGDISMTLPDYAVFVLANLRGLLGRDTILKSKTYQYLHYGLDNYSIGWANSNIQGRRVSEHAGSAGTFFSYTLIDPEKNIALVVVANAATPKTQEGIFKLVDRIKKQY